MKNKIFLLLIPLLLLGILYACAHMASSPKEHPVAVTGLPNCAECHGDRWAAWNHQASDFYRKHRFYAAQQRQACGTCHRESFCNDCHAYKEEIKPSDKYKTSPERSLPHRGDYLSRHRIEGRINPASCLKCHGRGNNERCKACHR
jgi:hypothetical protein